jgi:hypothetical protein
MISGFGERPSRPKWNRLMDNESLKINELEQVLVEAP